MGSQSSDPGSVSSAATAARLTADDRRLYDLDFAVGKSRRYHSRRRRFFELMDTGKKVVATLSGATAFFSLKAAYPEIAGAAAGVVAIVSAIDLVVPFGAKARLHDSLYRRFTDLSVDIAGSVEPTEQCLGRWRARRREIEGDEPAVMTTLDDFCFNEEAEGRGCNPAYRVPLKWWQIALMHWLDLPPLDRRPPSAGTTATV